MPAPTAYGFQRAAQEAGVDSGELTRAAWRVAWVERSATCVEPEANLRGNSSCGFGKRRPRSRRHGARPCSGRRPQPFAPSRWRLEWRPAARHRGHRRGHTAVASRGCPQHRLDGPRLSGVAGWRGGGGVWRARDGGTGVAHAALRGHDGLPAGSVRSQGVVPLRVVGHPSRTRGHRGDHARERA